MSAGQWSVNVADGRQAAALAAVVKERKRQDEKFGWPRDHADGTGKPGDERDRAFAQDACDSAAGWGKVTWRLILDEEVREAFAEKDEARLEDELVQVAAVATAWVEALRRRKASHAGCGPADEHGVPLDPDCPHRSTPSQPTCAAAGCGFCRAAEARP